MKKYICLDSILFQKMLDVKGIYFRAALFSMHISEKNKNYESGIEQITYII